MEVVVFVEIPAGSQNKHEYDSDLGGIVLDRRLFTSMSYPADWDSAWLRVHDMEVIEAARRGTGRPT